MGPLSQLQGDNTDGPEPEVAVDEERLQPRSDDEDTYVILIYCCTEWINLLIFLKNKEYVNLRIRNLIK